MSVNESFNGYNLEMKKAMEEFQRALNIRNDLKREPTNEQKLELYSLYKQV